MLYTTYYTCIHPLVIHSHAPTLHTHKHVPKHAHMTRHNAQRRLLFGLSARLCEWMRIGCISIFILHICTHTWIVVDVVSSLSLSLSRSMLLRRWRVWTEWGRTEVDRKHNYLPNYEYMKITRWGLIPVITRLGKLRVVRIQRVSYPRVPDRSIEWVWSRVCERNRKWLDFAGQDFRDGYLCF